MLTQIEHSYSASSWRSSGLGASSCPSKAAPKPPPSCQPGPSRLPARTPPPPLRPPGHGLALGAQATPRRPPARMTPAPHPQERGSPTTPLRPSAPLAPRWFPLLRPTGRTVGGSCPPRPPRNVVLGVRGLLLVLLRGLGRGGLRLALRASELARLVVPRLPLPLPLDLCLRRVLPPFHLLHVEAIDQTLFRDRGLRDTAPQPLQSTPEMESGKEGYTTHAGFEAKTYQRNVPRLGAHLDPPEILGILRELRHRVLRPPGGVGMGEKLA